VFEEFVRCFSIEDAGAAEQYRAVSLQLWDAWRRFRSERRLLRVGRRIMNRKGSAAIQAVAAGLLIAGCTIPLRIVVVNTTAEPVQFLFDLGVRDDDVCEHPSWNEYTPAAHLHRWFREPEWRPADAIAVDKATCTVQGTIPAHTALKLEYSVYPDIAERDGIALSLRGSAGQLTLQGAQIRRYFEEQSTGRFVLEYGGA
jgi:hypothetical protein